jgi:hypothetical protein
MKKPALIFILTVLSGSSSLIQAEDLVTKTGKTYADVVVTQSDDSTIRITFKEGVARLNLADLPVEWQQRYHYDPAKAAAHQAAREKEKKAQIETRQAALKLQAAASALAAEKAKPTLSKGQIPKHAVVAPPEPTNVEMATLEDLKRLLAKVNVEDTLKMTALRTSHAFGGGNSRTLSGSLDYDNLRARWERAGKEADELAKRCPAGYQKWLSQFRATCDLAVNGDGPGLATACRPLASDLEDADYWSKK